MVHLTIISGKKAGTQIAARRFPFHVGRTAKNQLQLDDDGIWDSHLTIHIQKRKGFAMATAPNAIVTINDQPVDPSGDSTVQRQDDLTPLRNGDVLTLGSAKIRFSLAPPRQRGLRIREFFVWTLIAAISATQVALVYWLIQMD